MDVRVVMERTTATVAIFLTSLDQEVTAPMGCGWMAIWVEWRVTGLAVIAGVGLGEPHEGVGHRGTWPWMGVGVTRA